MHRRECRFAILISIAVAVAGCSAAPEGPSTVEPAPASSSALEAAADTRIATLDSGGLRERATAALRERRIHAPAGDNAIEYYLALRERDPDDASVAAALVELQPYLLIAAEQALVRGENAESGRLLALMGRADPDAPALPRLREALREAERALAESKARAEAEAERRRAERSAGDAPAPAVVLEPVALEPMAPARPPALVPSVPDVGMAVQPPATASAPATSGTAAASTATAARAPTRVPRLLHEVQPRYPPLAMRRRIEGQVRVSFTVEPDGSVSSVRLLSAQPEGVFEDAAIQAARGWRFEPGAPSVTITRTLNFALPRGG